MFVFSKMRELPLLSANRIAAFNVFLNVVKGLATVIFLLIILLTTYTTVYRKNKRKMYR